MEASVMLIVPPVPETVTHMLIVSLVESNPMRSSTGRAERSMHPGKELVILFEVASETSKALMEAIHQNLVVFRSSHTTYG